MMLFVNVSPVGFPNFFSSVKAKRSISLPFSRAVFHFKYTCCVRNKRPSGRNYSERDLDKFNAAVLGIIPVFNFKSWLNPIPRRKRIEFACAGFNKNIFCLFSNTFRHTNKKHCPQRAHKDSLPTLTEIFN